MGRWLPCALSLVLAGCGEGGRPAAWITPRGDPATAEQARQLDRIERLIADGRDEQALDEIGRLQRDGLDHPGLHLHGARILARRDRLEDAIVACHAALAGSPGWVEPRIILVHCLVRLDRAVEAAQVFSDLDRLAPESPWGPYGIAWAASRRGDQAAARSAVQRALQRDPLHLPSLLILAGVERMAGDTAAEQAALDRVVRCEGAPSDAWERRGELAEAGRRTADARRDYAEAWRLTPRPDLARRLARLARDDGDAVQARQWEERAGGRR